METKLKRKYGEIISSPFKPFIQRAISHNFKKKINNLYQFIVKHRLQAGQERGTLGSG
jgi:hypothetical protein